MTEINQETRAGRMLAGMMEHGNRNARVVVTVNLTRQDGREFHQTFRFKAWDGTDGRMLTADLMDGDWAAGRPNTKVCHVNLNRVPGSASNRTFPAKNNGVAYGDELVLYAARAAVAYLVTGHAPAPANGKVEVEEEVYCGCCGRELTHPVSIDLGIGPECAKRAGLDHHYRGQTITSTSATRAAAEQVAAASPTEDRPAEHQEALRLHSLADDLHGRAGDFAIFQNGVKVATEHDSRAAMLRAAEWYGKHPTNRYTVVDEATAELVVEYDA